MKFVHIEFDFFSNNLTRGKNVWNRNYLLQRKLLDASEEKFGWEIGEIDLDFRAESFKFENSLCATDYLTRPL